MSPGTSQTVSRFQSAYSRMPICGCQRGERIRGDFRTGLGNGREQRGLAGVGIAHQADLGHDAEFQAVFALGAGFARLRKTRRLVARGGKIAVAQSAAPAFAQNKLLAVRGEVGHEFAGQIGCGRSRFGLPACSNQFPAPIRRAMCG
jgi:hypothetical protein